VIASATNQLAIKLLITPAFMICVTLTARRWGPKVAGLLAGLPLTSAPVSVYLAVEQGSDFAARAAVGSLSGVGSVGIFCLTYAIAARRFRWAICTSAGIASFAAFTVILRLVSPNLLLSAVGTAATLSAVIALFPFVSTSATSKKFPRWDLPVRAITATTLVLLLTRAASSIGAQLTGLVSPLPIFTNVVAAFSQECDGYERCILFLRGTVLASFGFASFFLVVGWALTSLGAGLTYSTASIAAILVSWTTFRFDRKIV
jgi:hypothetical protein